MRFNAEPIEIFWLCAGYDEKWINTGFERNAFRVVEGVHWEDGIDSSQEDIKSSFQMVCDTTKLKEQMLSSCR